MITQRVLPLLLLLILAVRLLLTGVLLVVSPVFYVANGLMRVLFPTLTDVLP